MVRNLAMKVGWGAMTAFAVYLFGFTLIYFSFRPDIFFLNEKQDVVYNVFWRTAFYIHITGGMLAILCGPFQFLRNFRNRHLKFHRTLGKLYLGSILLLAAPSGLFMAFYAEGGWFSSLGFTLMAMLWLLTTWKAYETILQKKIQEHRNWMIRSYALTFAAVTLRIWVPAASFGLGLDPEFVVISSAWISWIPNLVVAQLLTRVSMKVI